MSSLDKLKQALEEEAAADIRTIEASAEQKVAGIKAAAEAKAEKIKADILSEVQREIDEVKRKAQAEATLLRRRVMLTAKAALVDDVGAQASVMLRNLPADQYRAILAELLVAAAPTDGSIQVVLNEQDRAQFGEDFLAEVENRLRAEGRAVRLELAPQVGAMTGGLRVVGSDFEVDSTFERLLRTVGEACEPEIARVLFSANR